MGAYSKGESDQKFQPAGNYLPEGYSYSKAESDTNFQPKGNYATKSELINGLAGKQPVGDYATKTESNGKLAKDKNGADIPDKSEFINNLGLSEKFQPKETTNRRGIIMFLVILQQCRNAVSMGFFRRSEC